MSKWYDQEDVAGSNVVYSRVRLVRNLDGYVFPNKMTGQQLLDLLEQLHKGLEHMKTEAGEEFTYKDLGSMGDLERQALRERRILNAAAVSRKEPAGLMLSPGEGESLILGGDDHIRLQVLRRGLCLDRLWIRADQMDDYINERFAYAFDEKYGYLTSFPTNVGTGLRASVVLHLPILSKVRKFQSIVADMSRFGTAIRGIYGEGSDNYGSFYVVSNQRTLGQSEREIIDMVTKAAAQLSNQEQRVRQASLNSQRLDRVDEAFKSYGVLKYARKITEKDARVFLSILMGAEADGLIRFQSPCPIYSMIIGSTPANLRLGADRPLGKDEVDQARAAFIRENLPDIEKS